ncbi:hypothetical protein ABPG75_002237 [Micractinium tetrahymenae]
MSGGEEDVFVLVDREEEAVQEWSSRPRRSRLAGLLRPWAAPRRLLAPPAPAATAAPAPVHSEPLSAIPILSLPHAASSSPPPHTFINPLTSQPLQLHGLPAGIRDDDAEAHAECGTWLQQLPDPLPRPASAGSMLSGISACSARSSSSSSSRGSVDGGQGHALCGSSGGLYPPHRAASASAGSFVWPPRPAAIAVPSSSGGSGASSSSDLINLLMQQAEPDVPPSPTSPPAALAAGALPAPEGMAAPPSAAAAAAAPKVQPKPAVEAGTTQNPLLLQQLPEPQAALLSWRRHAHWQLGGERREPELLRRLLSGQSEDATAAAEAPLSPSAGLPAGGGRGRASGRHLLLLTAALALVVLLLHGLHSHALEQQLAGEQQEQQQQMVLYNSAAEARAQLQAAALQAAMLEAAEDLDAAAAGLQDASEAALGEEQSAFLAPRHAARSRGGGQPGRKYGQHRYSAHEASYLGRLPRLHLRRRLTLLLFTHSWAPGSGTHAASSSSGGSDAGKVEEFVFEEWELSMGRS